MTTHSLFHSARLKLTAWYLLIIMLVSLLFSVAIYRMLIRELNRFERMQRTLIERRLNGQFLPPPAGDQQPRMVQINPELIEETHQRIIIILLILNGGILILAGGLGYLLAGWTLEPIHEMLERQRRFISDASHELKTPLTAMRSEFEVALLDTSKMTIRDAVKLIHSGLEEIIELQRLAEHLLSLTRHADTEHSVRLERISLASPIQSAVKKMRSIAQKKHITITTDVSDTVFIKGNPQLLTELCVILLDNAVKYSKSDTEVTLQSCMKDGRAIIRVADHGAGIDPRDLPHIFERFYRADASRSRTSGFGLGLAIAYKTVRIHKGTIQALSKPGQGSEFIATFPID